MKTLKIARPIVFAALAVLVGAFLFSEAAYAASVKKPLDEWANVNVTVLNSDKDDEIHFEITYDLDSLMAEIAADGTVDIGDYYNRWRGDEPKTKFTQHDIDQMLAIGYMYERPEEPTLIYWTDYALGLHVNWVPIED